MKEHSCSYGHVMLFFNIRFVTDSYFVYVLKMEYEWNFWFKVSFSIIINPTKIFFLNPSMRKEGQFCHWICIFGPKSSLYEVNQWVWKWLCTWREFQKKILMVFTIRLNDILSQKLPPYAILSGILCVKIHMYILRRPQNFAKYPP